MPKRAPKPGPWLIGGAGRSGKTTLSHILATHSRTVAGFPLEGVFHVYLRRRFPFFRYQRMRLMHEYLNRPRYMNAARTHVEYPTDHFDADAKQLMHELPDTIGNPVALFGWLLDQYASSMGRQYWAVFDLLPELHYPTYRRLIPGIRLAVMRRDPREAIAEGLFWRSYPEPPADRDRRFKSMLFQWCLSETVTQSLSARFGNDVQEFTFNRLVAGDEDELARLSAAFNMDPNTARDAFNFVPGFEYCENLGFLGPDGVRHSLLTSAELDHIDMAVAGKTRYRNLRILLMLAPFAPRLARSLGDFILDPRTSIARRLNAIRQRAADAAAGTSAYWRAQR